MRRATSPASEIPVPAEWEGGSAHGYGNLLFACKEAPGLVIGAEICEDV